MLEETNLRNVRWDPDEQLMMVVWGNGIELYQYYHKNSLESPSNSEGIAMAVLLPFIELFATVFCMLQMLWTSSPS